MKNHKPFVLFLSLFCFLFSACTLYAFQISYDEEGNILIVDHDSESQITFTDDDNDGFPSAGEDISEIGEAWAEGMTVTFDNEELNEFYDGLFTWNDLEGTITGSSMYPYPDGESVQIYGDYTSGTIDFYPSSGDGDTADESFDVAGGSFEKILDEDAFNAEEGNSELEGQLTENDSTLQNSDLIVEGEFASTPEPTTMVLFGTGLIGIAGLARRRYTRDS